MLAASAFFGRAAASASRRASFFVPPRLPAARRLTFSPRAMAPPLPLREVGHVHPAGKAAAITLAVWLDYTCPFSVSLCGRTVDSDHQTALSSLRGERAA